jgi:hypothetical protein
MSDRLVSLLGFSGGAAVFLAVTLLGVIMAPQIDARTAVVVRHPVPAPTSVGAPVHPPVKKVDQIIQQNVDCWWPVPGYVCTGREYL